MGTSSGINPKRRESDVLFSSVMKDGIITEDNNISSKDPIDNMVEKMIKDNDKKLERFIQLSRLKGQLPDKVYKLLLKKWGLEEFDDTQDVKKSDDEEFQKGLQTIMMTVQAEKDPVKQRQMLTQMLLMKGGKYAEYAMQITLMGGGIGGDSKPEDDFTRTAREYFLKKISGIDDNKKDTLTQFTEFLSLAKTMGVGTGNGVTLDQAMDSFFGQVDRAKKMGIVSDIPKQDPMLDLERDKLDFQKTVELKKLDGQQKQNDALFDVIGKVGMGVAATFGKKGQQNQEQQPQQEGQEITESCGGCGTKITFSHLDKERNFHCPNNQCSYNYHIVGNGKDVEIDDGKPNDNENNSTKE